MHKTIYKSVIAIAFFAAITGNILQANNIDEKKDVDKKKIFEEHEFLNRLLSLHYGYRIMGEIVDPNGNVIRDVSVLSSKSQGPMADSSEQKTFLIKNGKFDFSSKGVFSWGLTFEKPQYYETTVGIGITNVAASLESGEAFIEGETIVKKVKVILYALGNVNRNLVRARNNVLSYSKESDIQKLTALVIPYLDNQNNFRKDEEFLFTFKKEHMLPKNLVYIVPGRNKDGSNDGTIRLKTNIPESGFIRQEYIEKHFFRNMQEAPETGYQPELILKEDFRNHNNSNVPFIVFYFKVKGIYGKGLIMPSDCDSKLETDKASLRVYFYMNQETNIRNTNAWIGTDW